MYLFQHIGGRLLLVRRGGVWQLHFDGVWGGGWASADQGAAHIHSGTSGLPRWDHRHDCDTVPVDLDRWVWMPDSWAV